METLIWHHSNAIKQEPIAEALTAEGFPVRTQVRYMVAHLNIDTDGSAGEREQVRRIIARALTDQKRAALVRFRDEEPPGGGPGPATTGSPPRP